jgi:hypothetical protein
VTCIGIVSNLVSCVSARSLNESQQRLRSQVASRSHMTCNQVTRYVSRMVIIRAMDAVPVSYLVGHEQLSFNKRAGPPLMLQTHLVFWCKSDASSENVFDAEALTC